MIYFGTAGNPNEFYESFKVSEQMPMYLFSKGLNAYEYQCSRGVKITDKKIEAIRKEAEKYQIRLSIHAPYYISLSTQQEEKQKATIQYIIDTMRVAQKMGVSEIVVHAGALLNLEREFAVESACKLLKQAYQAADELHLGDVIICPETMGKINQLGDSKEIIRMCQVDERLLPTIDFGHLYCRSLGALNSQEAWENELQLYIDGLGYDRMKHFHSHFSKMEYTLTGGEKRHVTFQDSGFGPNERDVLSAIKKLKLEPTIICESAGTQGIDALTLKEIYENI